MKNLNQSFHISKLIVKSFQQELDAAEEAELSDWLKHPKNQDFYGTLLQKDWEGKKRQIRQLHPEKSWKRLKSQIKFRSGHRLLRIFKYAAIAIIALTGGLFFYTGPSTPDGPGRQPAPTPIPVPGSYRASLLLASGEKIELANGQRFHLPQDSNVLFDNDNNTLKIKASDTRSSARNYTTLSVPKGGEYRLVLSDGSKIQLNSDSRLRFPSAFQGDSRTVFLKGEAYFEVAPNPEKPFVVSTDNLSVQVLGTKFNVKAYADDQAVYTTLVSGSVKTSSKQSAHTAVLQPNEQCIYTPADDRMQTGKVDPQVVLGWTQGRFIFENECLEEILKQLGRWYNVAVFYQNPEVANYRFSGNVNRFDQISTLLRMMEKTYHVAFSIRDNTIIVSKR